MIEYPGKASTVIFFGGCNFRCGYCHNPELVLSHDAAITTEEFFAFLEKRRRFLDAVCISGGEPTLQAELPTFLKQLKAKGLSVKLDTNGTNPDMLCGLVEDKTVDFVAMDIKGPSSKYEQIIRRETDLLKIKRSVELLKKAAQEGRIRLEFRTTVCRELLSEEDVRKMVGEYGGEEYWYLQSFQNPGSILDSSGAYSAYSPEEMKRMGEENCVNVR